MFKLKLPESLTNRFRSDAEKAASPSTKMAVALARTGHPTYEGTVPGVVVARRRAANRRARRARALHRRAARR